MIPDKVKPPYDYIPQVKTPVPYVEFVPEHTIPTIFIRADPAILDAYRGLSQKINDLGLRIDQLTALLDERNLTFSQQTDSKMLIILEDNEALEAVKDFFSSSGDEVVYPSDIAEQLKMPYEQALRIVEKLESDGEIGKA